MKYLDLTKTVYELTKEYPELIGIMAQLGFKEITKKAMLNSVGKLSTIPKGAKMKGIPMKKIVSVLREHGFEVDFEIDEAQTVKAEDKPVVSDKDARREMLKDYLRRLNSGEDIDAVLANFCENVEIIPAVNQVELHPFFTQEKALENMKAYGVAPQAWGPLAEGKHGIFTDPEIKAIGDKYGKSNAQVVLRWNAQRGVSIIPKSVKVERMQQNIDIWDFELTDEEMAAVAAKDLGHSEIVNHDDPMFVKALNGMNIHA